MANTVGLSDEAVESLLSIDNHGTQKAATRKSAIQRRMETPLSDRPAATVKRSSRRPPATRVEPIAPIAEEDSTDNDRSSEQTNGIVSPVVGSVVERPLRRPKEQKKGGTKKSRFAKQQQFAPPSAAGFPSVNLPIGTFVKPNPKSTRTQSETLEKAEQMTKVHDSLDSLQQASSKDAQAMLEGMSMTEIQESVQEIKSALSPDMIRFLKQRGEVKSSRKVVETTEPTLLQNDTMPKGVVDDREEKERVSKLLSSIQTYEDLDAACAAELEDTMEERDTEKDDFEVACDLLRSTVPRQNLWAARVVCHRVRDDFLAGKLCSLGKNANTQWPYPTLLPVSLRCLLDSSRVNGFVLHTYVLQSLYSLLQLRACIDHVVDVTDTVEMAASVFQQYFLDDAVPTPPLASCYSSAQVQPLNVGDKENVAYATNSSSTSAQADSEAFSKDPMWTLLSRMRILSRLAQLVVKDTPDSLLPKEAIVAVCGILAMIGQRSPGAASAIVQHPSLLTVLVERTLQPQDGSSRCDSVVALPTIILLCTLARQSRIAAAGLDVDSILLQILARKPDNEAEFKLQRWTLILWRTLLRYGLGLFTLSTMLTIAAPHLALGLKDSFSLATDFNASLACIARCIWVSRRSGEDSIVISQEQHSILANAGVWLSSSARTALTHLDIRVIAEHPEENSVDLLEVISRTRRLRFSASCLCLLEAFLLTSIGASQETLSGEFKTEDLTTAEEALCIDSVMSLLENKTLQLSLESVLPYAFVTDFDTVACESGYLASFEAAASAFLCSYLAIIMLLRDQVISHSLYASVDIKERFELVEDAVIAALVDGLAAASHKRNSMPKSKTSASEFQSARRGWLNRAHASIVKFLGTFQKLTEDANVRSLAYTVIGRLNCGDEATATTLLSLDSLFCPKRGTRGTESALPTMLIRELCRTPAARQQLDHSFKLQHGLGMTSKGRGPFDMQSLLSHADGIGIKSVVSDCLLPVGQLWLWQCLSSSAISEKHTATYGEKNVEASHILMNSLSLIFEQEDDDSAGACCYVKQFQAGAKLYFLMNLCLQPENILDNERIMSVAGQLLSKYTSGVQSEFVSAFVYACWSHSSTKVGSGDGSTTDAPKMTADEKKIASILEEVAQLDPRFSKDALSTLDDFVGDLCTAFIDGGAQHPFCTRCIRIFLLPTFPTKIRFVILRRLRGLLHLLSLDDDDYRSLLSQYLSSYTDVVRMSVRDDPAFLDAVVSVCSSDSRTSSGFFSLIAVSALSRSLAISLMSGSSTLATSRRRLQSLDREMAARVIETVAVFLTKGGTVMDLVDAVLDTSFPQHDCLLPDELQTCHVVDKWNSIVEFLKSKMDA